MGNPYSAFRTHRYGLKIIIKLQKIDIGEDDFKDQLI